MARMDTVLSMDELLPTKVERKEAGEISRVHDQPAIVTEATQEQSSTVNENDSISSKAEKFRKLRSPSVWLRDRDRNRSTKIRKVIDMLRKHKNFEKYCEPIVISFGPIHHGKPKYEIAEEYKLMWTREFIGYCVKDDKDVYEAVEKNIKQLREHFDEEVTKGYDNETLSWMLFVDGCALLQFMYSSNSEMFDEQQITNHLLTFARQDFFLLENQLPYQLLEDLMNFSIRKEGFAISIHAFIQEHFMSHFTSYLHRKELDVLRQENPSRRPIHLLDLLRTEVLGSPDSGTIAPSGRKKSIPNVQKLKAAGIHLKYGYRGSREIYFSRLFNFYRGILRVPQIMVNDSTGPMFFNLIAYEMSPDFINEFGITSYISFLNSIIKEADDVTELRKAGIVINFFGSDQEVAQLFKEIGMDLLPNPRTHSDVKYQIREYYDGKLSRICQFLYHNYKNPPWAVIGIVLSIMALVVTAIQTWLTVKETGSSGSGKG